MNRAERRQQAKQDAKRLVNGIDPRTQDAEPTAAMARVLLALVEDAKRDGDLDPVVRYLHAKVEATLAGTKDITAMTACKKGCAHCCHTWVSAPAPEILFLAKRIAERHGASAVQRIRDAHMHTKGFEKGLRGVDPISCPLLDQDLCSVYDVRPTACRFASSANADICARSFRQGSNESIPTPTVHLRARAGYQIALAIALDGARLPYYFYELNAGLTRALETKDAEKSWLSGDDIFLDVKRDPLDLLAHPQAKMMYRQALGSS
jgi:hypothetical protein